MPKQVLFVFTILLSLSSFSAHASLKEQMGEAAFEAAGLHKLTAEELENLEAFLAGKEKPVAVAESSNIDEAPSAEPEERRGLLSGLLGRRESRAPARSDDRFGEEQLEQEVDKSVPESISARIKGEFKGWDGKTVFRLDNGQVWQQRVGGRYRSGTRNNPEVVVERGRFGYYLKLVENGRSVGVRRIR